MAKTSIWQQQRSFPCRRDAKNALDRRTFATCLTSGMALVLTGCVSGSDEPPFYTDLSSGRSDVDPISARDLINNYRAGANLPPFVLDDKLNQIARLMAIGLSATNATSVPPKGDQLLRSRLTQDGFDAETAVYNVSAGYRRMSEAFSGWRDSDIHDANMKAEGLTHMGIATAFSGSSKYRVFWSLLLANPASPASLANPA